MKKDVKAKFQEALELPAELLTNSYRMTLIDNTNVLIENYKAIIEYEAYVIRLSCGLTIFGDNLNVLEISADEIIIGGKIKNIEFEN
ncbi:MAG: hypothetical protein IJX99_03135 [Clostridia bacterium]|nr:hypothetical protein [Clostridia bacterium]MBQ8298849.1 hypothetical protein [Clostridia bacterium]